jgi:putative membrane protein
MKRWHPLEKVLLGAFLFWSGAGLIFTLGRISPGTVAGWGLPAWLANFIDGCLQTGDPILLILAFANTHLHAARQWTPPLARRWALIVLVASLAIETIGTLTGFPFGAYHYTNRFGPLIGVVPLTIPLAWHVVVTNALFLVRAAGRHQRRLVEAGLTGLACTLYDFILEPFATGAKDYWVWDAGRVPAQNYAAWFVLSGLLVWIFAPTASTRFARDPRPVILLAMTLLIFLAGRWA